MAATPSAPLISLSPPKYSPEPSLHPLSLLSRCTSHNQLKQIQALAIKTHFQNDLHLLTNFINFCTRDPIPSSMDHACQLFETIAQPEIILFNSMARGYSRSNAPTDAVALFVKSLNSGLYPDDCSFPSLL